MSWVRERRVMVKVRAGLMQRRRLELREDASGSMQARRSRLLCLV